MARQTIEGLAVSGGLSVGPVFVITNVPFQCTGTRLPADQIEAGMARVEGAYAHTRGDLAEITDGAETWLADVMDSPLFRGGIMDRVASGQTPEDAVVQTTQDLVVIYGESPDPAFRARGEHVEEVGRRLFRRLHGLPTPVLSSKRPLILVTDEMSAFDAARLRADSVLGIVTARGGATSHFAIVAKQLGIPAVSGIPDVVDRLGSGDTCICDGDNGRVIISPDPPDTENALARITRRKQDRDALSTLAGLPAVTADGRPICLWGNIAGPQDVQPLVQAGATGVGMFRTEFIFMGDEAPSEERQAFIYGDVLRQCPGPVIMRTLEAGGDKTIPYLAGAPEENPNLGWQGLRMCLDMEPLFLEQLRGMLRASREGDLWIMFPLVSARWELDRCRQLVAKAHEQLNTQGVPVGDYKVGIMIEVPAAALLADAFLKDFDFCAIGTNDLTQFTLAADRMNPKVARWYDPFHPAVLKLIAMSAAAAKRAGKPIGMAGDMASDPLAIPFLLGVGLEILSVTAPQVSAVKRTIRAVDSQWARTLAAEALTKTSTEAVREYLGARQDEILRSCPSQKRDF